MRVPAGVGLVTIVMLLTSCASLERTPYFNEPGVSATIITVDGDDFPATFIGTEDGDIVFERSYPKTERLTVVERDGEPVVFISRLAVGTAVEIREFDVLVRERHAFSRVEEIRVATSAYFGWGALLGAVLTCGLVSLVSEN